MPRFAASCNGFSIDSAFPSTAQAKGGTTHGHYQRFTPHCNCKAPVPLWSRTLPSTIHRLAEEIRMGRHDFIMAFPCGCVRFSPLRLYKASLLLQRLIRLASSQKGKVTFYLSRETTKECGTKQNFNTIYFSQEGCKRTTKPCCNPPTVTTTYV